MTKYTPLPVQCCCSQISVTDCIARLTLLNERLALVYTVAVAPQDFLETRRTLQPLNGALPPQVNIVICTLLDSDEWYVTDGVHTFGSQFK